MRSILFDENEGLVIGMMTSKLWEVLAGEGVGRERYARLYFLSFYSGNWINMDNMVYPFKSTNLNGFK